MTASTLEYVRGTLETVKVFDVIAADAIDVDITLISVWPCLNL